MTRGPDIARRLAPALAQARPLVQDALGIEEGLREPSPRGARAVTIGAQLPAATDSATGTAGAKAPAAGAEKPPAAGAEKPPAAGAEKPPTDGGGGFQAMFAELEKLAAAGKKAQAALPSLGKSGLAKLTEAAAAAGASQDLDALAALAKKQLDSAGMAKELEDLKKLGAALAAAAKPEGGPAIEPKASPKALPPRGPDASAEPALPSRARQEFAEIHRKLSLIVRDAAEGLPLSGSFGGLAGELQYALCAILDEWLLFPAAARSVFVSGEAGRALQAAAPSLKDQRTSGWEPWLLEGALFGTAHAGRQVFFRMLQLPSRHLDEPVRRDLAHMYLALLELGFQGEWRNATESVEQCRQVLLPLLDEPETASVNLHVLSNEPDRRRAPMKFWWRALLYALLAYMILAVIVGLIVGFW